MLRSILKTICIVLISSILTYFLVGLFEYKEKILSTTKYMSKKSSDIVILTGGTNRIKDGLKIINEFEKTSTFNSKILVSGTGKGFTKTSLEKNINFDFDFNLIECCIELDSNQKPLRLCRSNRTKFVRCHQSWNSHLGILVGRALQLW